MFTAFHERKLSQVLDGNILIGSYQNELVFKHESLFFNVKEKYMCWFINFF